MRRLSPIALLLAACAGSPPPPPPPPPPPRVDPAPLLAEGVEARAAGDLVRSRDRLEAAVAADPGWGLPRLELAELLLDAGGDEDAARAERLLATPAREDNPRIHRLRGLARERAGDAEGAAERYAASLAVRADPDLRLHRAVVLDGLGRLEESATELERVRVERPDDLAARARLADVWERLGRVSDAERLLLEDARTVPPPTGAWHRLARFYERTGQRAKQLEAEKSAREDDDRQRELRPLRPSYR